MSAVAFSMVVTLGVLPPSAVRASDDDGGATPPPAPVVPVSLNLYRSAGFRFQDPNYVACTATSAQDMLNFVALTGNGGDGFKWRVSVSSTTRDSVLAYERAHDTIVAGSHGSDPHGWRNALNHYGWGDSALGEGQRVYEDRAFESFNDAVRTAVRQMILTGKPVGVLGWAGRHAQMITGYYGLQGNPLARTHDGDWANTFTVAGVYMTDPLRADGLVNAKVSLTTLSSGSTTLRFRRYMETDSPYDDPYRSGSMASRNEWYGHFVMLIPVR